MKNMIEHREFRVPEDRTLPLDFDDMMDYLSEQLALGGQKLNMYFAEVKFALEHNRENPAVPWRVDPKTFEVTTKIDHGIDTDIKDNFRATFPHVHYVGEELVDERLPSTEPEPLSHSKELLLIVDPLDGTDNFMNGDPYFSLGAAFYYRGQIIGSVIGEPQEDNRQWTARAHRSGAYLASRRISVARQTTKIEDARLGTAFAWDRKQRAKNQDMLDGAILPVKQLINRAGSVLDIAQVAAGKLTVHASFGLKPGDTAPGSLLVEKAGGKVTTIDNRAWTPFSQTTLASNGVLHDEGSKLFTTALRDAEERRKKIEWAETHQDGWMIRRPGFMRRLRFSPHSFPSLNRNSKTKV
jgi:myo-inositol-1(or 4)-monophosphatase